MQTYGRDYFFSGLLKKVVSGLSFFVLALISVKHRRSHPISVGTDDSYYRRKSGQPGQKSRQRKSNQKAQNENPGDPKGSRNKNKAEVVLNPELLRIQKMIQSLLNTIQSTIRLAYLVLDGHFGNYPAFQMVKPMSIALDFQAALRCKPAFAL